MFGIITPHTTARSRQHLAGNAIDLYSQVLGLSFHDAMRQITGT